MLFGRLRSMQRIHEDKMLRVGKIKQSTRGSNFLRYNIYYMKRMTSQQIEEMHQWC